MKYSILLFLFFVTARLSAQVNPSQNLLLDSLKKYSYFVNGYLKGAWSNGSGTGFFIKKDKKIFFVTNYHVYTGYDPITQENQPCDTISIRLKTVKDSLFIKLPSNRDSLIEKKIKGLEIGDLVALRLNKTQIKVCNSIGLFDVTQLLDTSYLNLSPANIFFYGFPSKEVTYSKLSKMLVPLGQISYSKFKKIDSSVYNKISRRNYIITDTSFQINYRKVYCLFSNLSTGGMSGSPIFGEYNIKGIVEYRLIGIVRGGGDKYLTEAINVQELLRVIKRDIR